jgi:hypothetical protein
MTIHDYSDTSLSIDNPQYAMILERTSPKRDRDRFVECISPKSFPGKNVFAGGAKKLAKGIFYFS